MDFEKKQAIYLQIGDHICENILTGMWREEERLPSTREMAIDMEVNPNTVMRTYADLQNKGIIHNKRGIGYFVSGGACESVLQIKRAEFVETVLPSLFRTMDLLEVGFDELKTHHSRHLEGPGSEEDA